MFGNEIRFFIEAATVALSGITGTGIVWMIWRVVVARKGRQEIYYQYRDDEL